MNNFLYNYMLVQTQ